MSEEERKNPVIFKKEVQNCIILKMSIKNKDSAKVLSGGNFDFNDSTGEGYHLTIKYTDYDDAAKMAIKTIRESKLHVYPAAIQQHALCTK